MAVAVEIERSLAAKFSTLLPHLDERTQWLYLESEVFYIAINIATESLANGPSGIKAKIGGHALDSQLRRPGWHEQPCASVARYIELYIDRCSVEYSVHGPFGTGSC